MILSESTLKKVCEHLYNGEEEKAREVLSEHIEPGDTPTIQKKKSATGRNYYTIGNNRKAYIFFYPDDYIDYTPISIFFRL